MELKEKRKIEKHFVQTYEIDLKDKKNILKEYMRQMTGMESVLNAKRRLKEIERFWTNWKKDFDEAQSDLLKRIEEHCQQWFALNDLEISAAQHPIQTLKELARKDTLWFASAYDQNGPESLRHSVSTKILRESWEYHRRISEALDEAIAVAQQWQTKAFGKHVTKVPTITIFPDLEEASDQYLAIRLDYPIDDRNARGGQPCQFPLNWLILKFAETLKINNRTKWQDVRNAMRYHNVGNDITFNEKALADRLKRRVKWAVKAMERK